MSSQSHQSQQQNKDVLFFTGYQTPLKQYKSYFSMSTLVENDKNHDKCITHSVGIIKAIIWAYNNNIKLTILAIDPPDLSSDVINSKIQDEKLDTPLRELYKEYVSQNIDISKYKIYIFRNKKNETYGDNNLYTQVNVRSKKESSEYEKNIEYYKDDTHYPYTIKHIRDKIISKFESL